MISSGCRLLVALVLCVSLPGGARAVGADRGPLPRPRIFGVTADDRGRLPAVLESLRALPRRPWVRVVLDVDPSRPADPGLYAGKVRELATAGNVLGELVDSSDLWRLTVRQSKARAMAFVRALRSAARLSADVAGRRVIPPPPHAAVSYQIGGPFPPGAGVEIVDRDWHVAPAPRAYGICYINAFQAQPEALSWWRSRHPSLLLRRDGQPVIDTGWNEQLLDTSTRAKRRLLRQIIGGWIDRCARAGYRAVEPDNLDSWSRSRGMLTAAENLALARLLIHRAHAAGLAIAQKNTAELVNAGRRLGFDFAIAEECQPFHECGSYLSAYGNRVIEMEYPDNGGERNFLQACRLRGDRISIVYRDRDVTPAGHAGFIERRCPSPSAASG